MFAENFFNLSRSGSRRAAIFGAVFLILMGIFLGFSIVSSLFELGGFLSAPGDFFVRCYGFMAFFIPAYLIYAAFLLADPGYRPDRIFILSSLVFPFVTLGIGFYWLRNFDDIAAGSVFFMRAGKTGIGFLAVFVTVIECLCIALFRSLIFSGRGPLTFIFRLLSRLPKIKKRIKPAGFLPRPIFKPRNLNEIYTESAASGLGFDPAAGGNPAPIEREIPSGTEAPLVFAEGGPTENSPEAGSGPRDIPELPVCNPAEPAAESETELEAGSENVPAAAGESAPNPAADPEAESSDYNGAPDIEEAVPAAEAPADAENASAIESSAGNAAGAGGVFPDVEEALAEAEEAAARHENRPPKETSRQKKKNAGPYSVPVEGILNQYPDGEYWIIDEATRNAALTLKETLKEFKIQAEVTGIKKGPVITMFEILPAPGVKLSRIVNLQDNIALRLAASSVRIVAPIPGKHAVGIEVPNAKRNIVSFREIIVDELYREGKKPEIPVVLGKDITGEAITVDLATMPHLLIAGATGSGKSVCVNTMILSILYQRPPSQCRLILIDPKIVELKLYNDIGHLLTPVITEPKRAFQALQYCIYEMERRYACLDSMGVRDIKSYNKRIKEREIAAEHMPYIVVIIDEFADLMATTGKELESTVARLAAMSRAVGIHLVLATQRPSIDIITGLIKANIPSRIAFMVAGRMNSQIIIDSPGAEKLLGKGDMLYAGVVDPFPIRMQGAFVSEEEVERVVDYIKSLGEPDYIDEEIFYDDEEEEADPALFSDGGDPLYDKALEIILQQGKASASYIQRRLKIGYNRAARLVEEMEQRGVVGPAQGSKPREVLRGSSFG